MTNLPPDPPSSPRSPLGFDEFIAILVAFGAIGAILFWSIGRRDRGLDWVGLPGLLTPSPSPTVAPTPAPTATTAPILPLPTVAPTAPAPEAIAPAQPRPFAGIIPVPAPVPQATPTPEQLQPTAFVDVPENHWARPFIDVLSARGIVSGFAGDYFRPDRPVTRAEFAAILQAAFDQQPGPGEQAIAFTDVPTDFWGVPAIGSAIRSGFMQGYPGNIFQPQQQIPRAQVLVALASGLNLPTPQNPEQTLGIFEDADQIPNWAVEQVAGATDAGLVVNYPETNVLEPNRNASRAEVTASIYQALVRAGRVEPIQSQYVVQQ
ncbi:S-layer homology domain-containing protein [Gloeocapsopsis dulcis]|uniref:S-layer protein n=1 Tax=Gloeocapsopsis dulcis AAB1 = 1H9 TaxID=1433147 RepID=A0A6N8G138_9CHRO|nr:S-layer homology domain-containing protein [Gloeocapsopsis dulcis]MUL38704.1 S-layer protein [Gloeocapsopsis dulcis AAB1 = 1H9]WNN88879.1 S-layer homology domain-containing protein [Gloeocapsopsis dulcis]